MMRPHNQRSIPFFAWSLVSCAAVQAAAAPPLFDSPSRAFVTGEQVLEQAYRPNGLAAADFDGDGDLDIALAHVGNFISPHMSVQMNNGDGSYAPGMVYDTAGETMEVVAADLDGDGDVDLAFAQSNFGITGNRVLVFLNEGDGTFGPEHRFTTGEGPTSIVAFDADNDGDLDLATTSYYWDEEDVSVLYNDGSAGFDVRADFPIPDEQPYKIEAGDLDGDGWTDLVVTVRGGHPALSVLFNDGTGAFGAPIPYLSDYPYGIEVPGLGVADVDLDDDLDVLYAVSNGGLALFRNQGTGSLVLETLPVAYEFGLGHDFAVADVTNDGWPDILAVEHSSQTGYVVFPSDAAGGFGSPTTFPTGEMARSIAVADVNGDDDVDVLVANSGSNTVTVHTNSGGSFRMPDRYDVYGCWSIDAGDLDNDGDIDLVSTEYDLNLLHNDGTGTFDHIRFSLASGRQRRVHLADVTGDGYLDVLTLDDRSNPPYYFHVLVNNGSGFVMPPVDWFVGGCGPGNLATGDIDADGDLDVVVTEYLGCGLPDQFYVYFNDGAGNFPVRDDIEEWRLHPENVLIADFDHDDRLDLVGDHSETISFWRGHGDGTFDSGIDYGIDEWGPKYMTAADFDGDGHLDVATTNYGDTFRGECISVIPGYGDGGFGRPEVYYGIFSLQYGGVSGIDTLDANADGKPDIVAGSYGANDVCLFLNAGDGTFLPEQRYGVSGEVLDVVAADFNGDGAPDVAAGASGGVGIGQNISIVFGIGERVEGDVNGDGLVDFDDLLELLAAWGPCEGACPADLDMNGMVDFGDLLIVLANWT